MQIKASKEAILPKQLLWVVGLLAVVLTISVALTSRPSPPTHSFSAPIPDSTLAFLQKRSSLPQVLKHFHRYELFLSVREDAAQKLPDDLRNQLKEIGGEELSQIQKGESYVGLIAEGRFQAEKRSAQERVSLQHQGIQISSTGQMGDEPSRLKTREETYPAEQPGLHVFVLTSDGRLIGSYAFDFQNEEKPLAKSEVSPPYFPGVDKIEIVLDQESYAQLEEKRKEALRSGVLLTGDEDLVPGRIVYKDQEYKGELRLKGDWLDHLQGEQWSFRVKLRSGQTMRGMRKFSLHHPKTRNYVGEWLFHQLLQEAGLLNLQYDFVQVKLTVVDGATVASKELGLYALEEFFDKQLVERNQRREGVILKVDEDPLWQERADFIAQRMDLKDLEYLSQVQYEDLNILPFSAKKVMEDPNLHRQFLTARELFQDFIEGKRLISEVFDVEKLAKYNAICNLLGANHALLAHNYRVYYNPINSRLEPIGFDANALVKEWYPYSYHHADRDPNYQAAYARALEEVTGQEYIDAILSRKDLRKQIELLQAAYPGEFQWDPGVLKHNRNILLTRLFPARMLNIFFVDLEDGLLRLNIENYGKFPVEVLNLQNEGQRVFGEPLEAPVIIGPNARQTVAFWLDEGYRNLFVKKKKVDTGFDLRSNLDQVGVLYQTLGTTPTRTEAILPWSDNSVLAETDLFRNKPNTEQFDFLTVDEEARIIYCQAGSWTLDQALIIPPDYTFQMPPGTRIDLISYAAKVLSFSPVALLGTADAPVEFHSSTGKGRGLLVLNTSDTSYLNYCKFTGLSNPETKGWVVTGAVNFYDAPVKIDHCSFSENKCEDALNIISTYFEMDHAIFHDIYADAFDGDFVTGVIRNSLFGNLGNDAIDISGSQLEVSNVLISEAGDKGLSAGENSSLQAEDVVVKDSEIALASKDRSVLIVRHSALRGNQLSFTAFQKKPEFGPARIEADSIELDGNKVDFLIEQGSALLLDGKEVETEEEVKERMYGVEFGKKSG